MAIKGVKRPRGTPGGQKAFVGALPVDADIRVWLLEYHEVKKDNTMQWLPGLKAVLCTQCQEYAYFKSIEGNRKHRCTKTAGEINIVDVLSKRPKGAFPISPPSPSSLPPMLTSPDGLVTRNLLWAHDVDAFEAEIAGLSVAEARSAGCLSPTRAERESAKRVAQHLLGFPAFSPCDVLDDWQSVYCLPTVSFNDASLAAAYDHVAVHRNILPDTTHRFGSTTPTTIFLTNTPVSIVQWMAREMSPKSGHKPRWLQCTHCDGVGLGKYGIMQSR